MGNPSPIADDRRRRRTELLLLSGLAVLTALRAWFAAGTELTPDEAYYWTWAQEPAAGYLDHPPLVAWLIRLGTLLLGNSALGVRLFSLVSGALVPWILFRVGLQISATPRQALGVASLAALSPILSVGAVVHTPDAALALAWSGVLWAGLRLFHRDRLRDWLLLGVAVGLAILAKGTGWALLPSLLLFFTGCLAGRSRLSGAGLLLAIGAALLIAFPNAVWNSRHQGGAFAFQLSHVLAGMSPSPLQGLAFLGGQAGVVGPLAWLGAVLFVAVGWRTRIRNSRPEVFWLWALSAPLLVFVAGLAFVHKVEANWPAVAYLGLLPALPWLFSGGAWYLRRKGLWFALALGLSAGLTLVIHLHALLPFLPLDPERDPTARLRGWRELAAEASADAQDLGAVLGAEGYAAVSELRFYAHDTVVYQPSAARVSQFDLWERELPPRPPPQRVLFLQPVATQGDPTPCKGAPERWQLIKEPGERPRRATAYRWWVCGGLPAPEKESR